MAAKTKKAPPVPFVGKADRRCRNCMRRLAEHYRLKWRKKYVGRKSPENKNWSWELTLRCTACNKKVGKVADSNMPEDPALLPPKPPTYTQKGLFDDAGKTCAQKPDWLP